MLNVNRKYLEILRVEIAGLEEDIRVLIEHCKQERESGRLTNYVFMENLALFENEILGVNMFRNIVDEIDPDRFDSLDALVSHLKDTFREKLQERGLVKLISVYVSRKLDKVARYVEH